MSVGVVYLCRECRSPSVSFGQTHGSKAVCRACGWEGIDSQLIAAPFVHDFLNDESAFIQLTLDLRNLLGAEAALPIVKFLDKWGFISTPFDPKEIGRYVAAAARGMLREIIKEREEVLKDGGRRDGEQPS